MEVSDNYTAVSVVLVVAGAVLLGAVDPVLNPEEVSAAELCEADSLPDEEMYIPLSEPTESPEMRSFGGQTPDVSWSINENHLRDDPFSARKPNGTYRILVVGGSQTVGIGLNESQRYTEKLERKLEERFSTDIQVINAGFAGAGMRDFYLYLYNEGFDFDPDLVVVTLQNNDDESKRIQDRRIEEVLQEHNMTGGDFSMIRENEEALESYAEMQEEFQESRNWNNSHVLSYGNRIAELSSRHDTDLLYYVLHPVPEKRLGGLVITDPLDRTTTGIHHLHTPIKVDGKRYGSTLEAWENVCGRSLVYAPQWMKPSTSNTTHTFAGDPHYNEKGNEVLAEKLTERLVALLERRRME